MRVISNENTVCTCNFPRKAPHLSIRTETVYPTPTLTFKLLDTLALRRPQVLRRGWKLFLGHCGRTRVLRTARRNGQGRCQKSVYSCALAGDMCFALRQEHPHPSTSSPTRPPTRGVTKLWSGAKWWDCSTQPATTTLAIISTR